MVKKQCFFLALAVVITLGFFLPRAASVLDRFFVIETVVFFTFLITGLSINTINIIEQFTKRGPLLAALASSLLLMPFIAFFLNRMFFPADSDFGVGIMIITVVPVTIISGTVMTSMAGGNVALSVMLCVVGNLLGLFTVPVLLPFFLQLGDSLELPVPAMFQKLVLMVMVPTFGGQLLRPWLAGAVKKWQRELSVFSQSVVLLIVFNAVASSSELIVAGSVGREIIKGIVFIVLLHFFFLAMNYALARLMKLDTPSVAGFTIHTSQKTLTVSYVIWSGYFAENYPMAMLPGIVYHLTQMIADTLVAKRFRAAIMS